MFRRGKIEDKSEKLGVKIKKNIRTVKIKLR